MRDSHNFAALAVAAVEQIADGSSFGWGVGTTPAALSKRCTNVPFAALGLTGAGGGADDAAACSRRFAMSSAPLLFRRTGRVGGISSAGAAVDVRSKACSPSSMALQDN